MKALKHVGSETWRVIRFIATGETRSRRQRQALANYQRYQARERAAEERGER